MANGRSVVLFWSARKAAAGTSTADEARRVGHAVGMGEVVMWDGRREDGGRDGEQLHVPESGPGQAQRDPGVNLSSVAATPATASKVLRAGSQAPARCVGRCKVGRLR